METNPTKTGTSSDDIIELDVTVYSHRTSQGFDVAENIAAAWTTQVTMGTTEVQSLRFESLNLNHFAGDDVFICGSEYTAHIQLNVARRLPSQRGEVVKFAA